MARKEYKLQIVIDAIDKASKSIKNQIKNLDELEKKNKEVVKTFKNIGYGLTALSAAGVSAFTLGVKAAANFEAEMANVNTMLDTQTEKLLPNLAKAIEEMSVKYGEGTKTLSKGLYDILSAGVSAEKSIQVLDASVRAARAGLVDTGTAADALTTILNAYNLSAERATDVSDLLFAIVKTGKTTMGELAPQIGMVAGLAANAGMSLEDMGAALGTMTAAGLKTDIAITSLKGIITSFLKPQQESIQMARKYGIELNANTLRTKGLIWVLNKLKKARKEDLAAIFPNVRALTGMATLLQNNTKFTKNYAVMVKRAGKTEEAFEKQTKTLNFQFNKLRQSIVDAGRKLGRNLIPEVKNIVRKATDLINKFSNLDEKTRNNIVRFGLLATAISGVGGVVSLLIGNILNLAKNFLSLASTIVTVGKNLTLLATNPFILSLGAIAAGVALIAKKFIELRQATDEQVEAYDRLNMAQMTVQERMKVGFETFKKYKDLEIEGIADKRAAYQELTKGIQGLYTALANASEDAKPRIQAEIDLLKQKRDKIKEIIGKTEEMGETGKTASDEYTKQLNALITKLGETKDENEATTEKIKNDWKAAIDEVIYKTNEWKDFFVGVMQGIKEAIASAYERLMTSFGKGFKTLKQNFKGFAESLREMFIKELAKLMASKTFKAFMDAFSETKGAKFGKSFADAIIKGIAGNLGKGVGKLLGGLLGGTAEVGGLIGEGAGKAGEKLGIVDVAGKVASVAGGAGKLVAGGVSSLASLLGVSVPALGLIAGGGYLVAKNWGKIKDAVGKTAQKIGEGINKTADKIKKFFKKLFQSGGIGSGWALVGEQGAELVRLPTGSRVFNHRDTMRMLGSGGINVYVNVTGNTISNNLDLRILARKVGDEIVKSIKRERNF